MKYTPSLRRIILVFLLIVTFVEAAACHTLVWDERLVPPGRVRRRYNPRRNRERRARRWVRQQRRRPPVSRAARRRRRTRILRQILDASPGPVPVGQRKRRGGPAPGRRRSLRDRMEKPSPIAETPSDPDPLADLRQARGWIDHMDERELWAMGFYI